MSLVRPDERGRARRRHRLPVAGSAPWPARACPVVFLPGGHPPSHDPRAPQGQRDRPGHGRQGGRRRAGAPGRCQEPGRGARRVDLRRRRAGLGLLGRPGRRAGPTGRRLGRHPRADRPPLGRLPGTARSPTGARPCRRTTCSGAACSTSGPIGPAAFRESLTKHVAGLKAVTPFDRLYLSGASADRPRDRRRWRPRPSSRFGTAHPPALAPRSLGQARRPGRGPPGRRPGRGPTRRPRRLAPVGPGLRHGLGSSPLDPTHISASLIHGSSPRRNLARPSDRPTPRDVLRGNLDICAKAGIFRTKSHAICCTGHSLRRTALDQNDLASLSCEARRPLRSQVDRPSERQHIREEENMIRRQMIAMAVMLGVVCGIAPSISAWAQDQAGGQGGRGKAAGNRAWGAATGPLILPRRSTRRSRRTANGWSRIRNTRGRKSIAAQGTGRIDRPATTTWRSRSPRYAPT